jgi:hypothetical protein
VKGTVGGVTTIYIGNYFEWICRRSLRSLQQTLREFNQYDGEVLLRRVDTGGNAHRLWQRDIWLTVAL